ncbi:hypothetical protein BpHYR1_001661 [Brachionus plicatilis]|uniref:Uncharacterized protein n=1 Tax=Brachionus plicatilis TaxID=10195 RepID=A0A3M7P9W9_BRAPC|nr:hypothetical protein BpHYR1_001661 [Brachionus plicatilis]
MLKTTPLPEFQSDHSKSFRFLPGLNCDVIRRSSGSLRLIVIKHVVVFEKLNQHKLISKFSQFSNLLDNLIQTVYFLYIILFIDKNSIRRRSRVFSIIADWWIGFLFSAFLIFNPYFDAAEWLSSTINCLMQIKLFVIICMVDDIDYHRSKDKIIVKMKGLIKIPNKVEHFQKLKQKHSHIKI